MAAIGEREIEFCYKLGLAYHRGEIPFEEAVEKAVAELKMNRASSSDYIRTVHYMIEGRTFKRTINAHASELYLRNILRDFGANDFSSALAATKAHVKYYEELQKTTQHKMREVIEKFENEIVSTSQASDALGQFQKQIERSSKDSEEVRQQRVQVSNTKPKRRMSIVESFIRNPDVVAQSLADA